MALLAAPGVEDDGGVGHHQNTAAPKTSPWATSAAKASVALSSMWPGSSLIPGTAPVAAAGDHRGGITAACAGYDGALRGWRFGDIWLLGRRRWLFPLAWVPPSAFLGPVDRAFAEFAARRQCSQRLRQ